MKYYWIILALLLIALAAPAANVRKSWRWFFVALVLSFAGVVLPLFIFLFSAFLQPDWKGACLHGWLDCFIVGKLALTPLALWATAAWYALEILRVQQRTSRWIVLGFLQGAVIAWVCLIFGLACIRFEGVAMIAWMLVPLYVAVWYSVRAMQLMRTSGVSWKTHFTSLAGSLPFWVASWFWARSEYATLPDKAPSCFVVTAAGRGHEQLVGPFVEIQRSGGAFRVNQQLITLWQFENLWCRHQPQSHALARRIYNRVGPVLAARIKAPWQADLAYLAIKPLELLARLVTALTGKFPGDTNSKK